MKNNPESLRRKYPEGTRITLEYMEGEPRMKPGLKGTVSYVDDIGQIHVAWENGSSLALNPYLDKFQAHRPSLGDRISDADVKAASHPLRGTAEKGVHER